MVYYHFPFINDDSETAAEASECAGVSDGAGGFWRMVDSIYAQGSGIDPSGARDIANSLGLDIGAWDSCMDSGGGRLAWQADYARGQGMGVSSTPTIFLAYIDENGEQTELEFRGGQQYSTFSSVLDSILERVEQPSY